MLLEEDRMVVEMPPTGMKIVMSRWEIGESNSAQTPAPAGLVAALEPAPAPAPVH